MKALPLFCLLGLPCALFALGCSSGGSAPPPPAKPPTITSQPSSQTAQIGALATFTVAATGTGTLTYQWTWNGAAVSGATGSSYTTPAIVSSDNQSTLGVSITNSVATTTSSPAVLTVAGAPRPPRAGDLRFQNVDAFPMGVVWFAHTELIPYQVYTCGLGSPLAIGCSWAAADGNPMEGAWTVNFGNLPSGLTARTTTFLDGAMSYLQTALQDNTASNQVITSLDLDARQQNWAMESVEVGNAEGGYSFNSQTLAPQDLQAAATQAGAAGQVITAVSLNGGQATYLFLRMEPGSLHRL